MVSSPAPRLRFAPSPTGALHVGNARTALINWLVARRAGGRLVVRVEDTDAERSAPGLEAAIIDDLRWLGLDWDEGPDVGGEHGPYRQSERFERYRAAARLLVEAGFAYPCFRSSDEIKALRDAAHASGEPFRYRGEHRDATPERVVELLGQGGAALRFRVPDKDVRFVDGLRGETGLAAGEIGDFVVARADGTPTYNLAVVVDDHDMAIDRVVRGEDHLTNTPRQLLLYEAFSWTPPSFTHLPLVLGPDRTRLSKRHGATSVGELRDDGILPEALCNFLALLGWSPPNEQEVLGMAALRDAYDVADLAAANAVFDRGKLEWLNGQHIAALPAAELLDRAAAPLAAAGFAIPPAGAERDWWAEIVQLVGIGRRSLEELAAPLGAALYPPLQAVVADAADELREPQATAVLGAFVEASRAGELATEEAFSGVVQRIRESTGAGGRKIFHPLRLAISGQESGPELKRLVPLLESGAGLPIEPPVASVGERIELVLGLVGARDGARDGGGGGDAAAE